MAVGYLIFIYFFFIFFIPVNMHKIFWGRKIRGWIPSWSCHTICRKFTHFAHFLYQLTLPITCNKMKRLTRSTVDTFLNIPYLRTCMPESIELLIFVKIGRNPDYEKNREKSRVLGLSGESLERGLKIGRIPTKSGELTGMSFSFICLFGFFHLKWI